MAADLIDREVSLHQFTDEKVQSSTAQDIIRKVKLSYLAGIEGGSLLTIPQTVKVRLLDGTEYSHQIQWPKGYANNPMSWDEIAQKFRNCTNGILHAVQIDQAIDILSKLETLSSVSKLMAIFSKIKL